MTTVDDILDSLTKQSIESLNEDFRGLYISDVPIEEVKKIHGAAKSGVYCDKNGVVSVMTGTENKEYINIDMYLDSENSSSSDAKWFDVFGKEVVGMNADIKSRIDALAKKGKKITFVYSGDKDKFGNAGPKNKDLRQAAGTQKRIKCQMYLKKKTDKKNVSGHPSKYTFLGSLLLHHVETITVKVPGIGNASQDVFYFGD